MNDGYDTCSNEELLNIYKKYGSTDVLNILIRKNKNLIYHIINRYYSYMNKDTKEDLYQEGLFALFNCIKKYDKNKEVLFSTYAYNSIINYLIKFNQKNTVVVISPIEYKRIYDYKKYNTSYLKKYNRPPTDIEVKKELSFTDKQLNSLKLHIGMLDMMSFDDVVNNADNKDLEKIIENNDLHNQLLEFLQKNLKNKMEYNVIVSYYGLIDNIPLNHKEIADKYNISVNQVQYLKSHTLEKLKNIPSIKKFKIFC